MLRAAIQRLRDRWAQRRATADYERGLRDGLERADQEYQELVNELIITLSRLRVLKRDLVTISAFMAAFKGKRPL